MIRHASARLLLLLPALALACLFLAPAPASAWHIGQCFPQGQSCDGYLCMDKKMSAWFEAQGVTERSKPTIPSVFSRVDENEYFSILRTYREECYKGCPEPRAWEGRFNQCMEAIRTWSLMID